MAGAPVEVDVRTNLPDFKKQLDLLAKGFEKQVVGPALSAAGKVFKAAVVANAEARRETKYHKDHVPGTLARAIYSYRLRNPKTGTVEMKVSFRKGKAQQKFGRDAYFGKFLEEGWIPRGPGQKIRGGRRSKALQRQRLAHLKISRPFIRPAFDASAPAALSAFNSAMVQQLAKLEREK
jgi:hypothetical protein